ncbi:hypothetical protein CYMTET_25311, partial [Cymbomonas tetramitiformis]
GDGGCCGDAYGGQQTWDSEVLGAKPAEPEKATGYLHSLKPPFKFFDGAKRDQKGDSEAASAESSSQEDLPEALMDMNQAPITTVTEALKLSFQDSVVEAMDVALSTVSELVRGDSLGQKYVDVELSPRGKEPTYRGTPQSPISSPVATPRTKPEPTSKPKPSVEPTPEPALEPKSNPAQPASTQSMMAEDLSVAPTPALPPTDAPPGTPPRSAHARPPKQSEPIGSPVAKAIRSWEERAAPNQEEPVAHPPKSASQASKVASVPQEQSASTPKITPTLDRASTLDFNPRMDLASDPSKVSPVLNAMQSGYSDMMKSAQWAVSAIVTAIDDSEPAPRRQRSQLAAQLKRSASDANDKAVTLKRSPIKRSAVVTKRSSIRGHNFDADVARQRSLSDDSHAKRRVRWSEVMTEVRVIEETSWSEDVCEPVMVNPNLYAESTSSDRGMQSLLEMDMEEYLLPKTGFY